MAAVADISALAAPQAGLRAVVHGRVTTTTRQGVDTNSQVAALHGASRVPGIGNLNLLGVVNSSFVNVRSLPDRGQVTLVEKNARGTLTLSLRGPHSNLASRTPTTTHFSFTVTKAIGQFAPYARATGTADLTLSVQGPSAFNPAHTSVNRGNFTLVLTQA